MISLDLEKWQILYFMTPNYYPMQIEVSLTPSQLRIVVNMRPVMNGQLYAAIKKEDSVWFLDGRTLTLLLLKSNRRDHYKNGSSNAETFWPGVLSTGDQLKVVLMFLLSLELTHSDQQLCMIKGLNVTLCWKILPTAPSSPPPQSLPPKKAKI